MGRGGLSMEYIVHRVNRLNELKKLPGEYGVELDLRDDYTGKIYIQHNPFEEGEDFEDYLKSYHHGTMIMNIKSERIEYRALDLVRKYGINNYFFLDSTFPMIKALSDTGEKNIALRYSEYEGLDTLKAMAGKVGWVWVDTFSIFPMDYDTYTKIKEWGYRICMVSPELQGQPEKIELYAKQIAEEKIEFDAICTKGHFIQKWKTLNNIKGY